MFKLAKRSLIRKRKKENTSHHCLQKTHKMRLCTLSSIFLKNVRIPPSFVFFLIQKNWPSTLIGSFIRKNLKKKLKKFFVQLEKKEKHLCECDLSVFHQRKNTMTLVYLISQKKLLQMYIRKIVVTFQYFSLRLKAFSNAMCKTNLCKFILKIRKTSLVLVVPELTTIQL